MIYYLFSAKHFYLALNGSKRDKEDYLAWVETDQEGRIRNRIKRFNRGKADRRAYQDRERKNEAFLRDDGIRVAFVQLNNDGSCVVRYENSTGNWCMRTFRPYLPAGKYDLIHRCFVA